GHRSLLVAYTRSRGRVGASEVTAAARELGYVPQAVTREGRSWPRWAAVGGAGVAAATVAFFLFGGALDDTGQTRAASVASQRSATASPAALAPLPAVASEASLPDLGAGTAVAAEPVPQPDPFASASASAEPAAVAPASPP